MQKFTTYTGTAIPLRHSNVDTDQIIPARFCIHSSKTGHADSLFADWRENPSFVFNNQEYNKASILVAGNDFGIGSSREYAVWALQNYGFRTIFSPRFGDIFRNNSLLNGLLTIVLPIDFIEDLWDLIESLPNTKILIDLYNQKIQASNLKHNFVIDEAVRYRLLRGLNPIESTLRYTNKIINYEYKRSKSLPISYHTINNLSEVTR